MRCVLHRWTKWEDSAAMRKGYEMKILIQVRRCRSCNLKQRRNV